MEIASRVLNNPHLFPEQNHFYLAEGEWRMKGLINIPIEALLLSLFWAPDQ